MTSKLLCLPAYRSADTVAVFLSLPDEVCTAAILADLLASGKRCYIPKYWPGSNRMEMVSTYLIL